MPELPEVEVSRRAITPHLEGRRIEEVGLGGPRTTRRNVRPNDVVDRLMGRLVERVTRTGKFIMIHVEEDLLWVIHLGMSGRLLVADPDTQKENHTHFWVRTDKGKEVRFVDPRTFGFVAVFTPEELESDSMACLGRDAWHDLPTLDELADTLRDRTAPIKPLLLDQRIIAGLGNIYTDEILFLAGIDPHREGGSLTRAEIESLHEAVSPVLGAAIASNGTSLSDLSYLLPDGRAGEMLQQLQVYGMEGEPCPRCGTEITRRVLRGRSTHFCPHCQR